MDFADQIKLLSNKIEKQKDSILTEEATKNAFVLPFISALGYDVFNPLEVIPELTADHGIKKGEKVDYAIANNGNIIMLFECKSVNTNLNDANMSQLFRYFSVTESRIGILTNGIDYKFFTDLEEPNKMDTKPFLEINFLNLTDASINELKKFSKTSFDLDKMISAATELKYTKEIKHIMSELLNNPDEEFVRLFASRVYSGMLTQKVRNQFSDIVKRALNQFINERLNDRLKSALTDEDPNEIETEDLQNTIDDKNDKNSHIITTEEELQGFYIVKSILVGSVDLSRVYQRDTISYFGILLDDNNRKPLCRLHFNSPKKYIGLFDEGKKEQKVTIDSLDDIYKFADKIKTTLKLYE